ncbi:unnamed protein product, partial [Staurois parvus]
PIGAARPQKLPWGPRTPGPPWVPGPKICQGPLTAGPTCWVPQCVMGPVPPPIAPTLAMCHFQVSSHSLWFPFCHSCWQLQLPSGASQAPNLPWAPVPPGHAAAGSTVCHGSLYRLPLSPSHSAMCHFQVSS